MDRWQRSCIWYVISNSPIFEIHYLPKFVFKIVIIVLQIRPLYDSYVYCSKVTSGDKSGLRPDSAEPWIPNELVPDVSIVLSEDPEEPTYLDTVQLTTLENVNRVQIRLVKEFGGEEDNFITDDVSRIVLMTPFGEHYPEFFLQTLKNINVLHVRKIMGKVMLLCIIFFINRNCQLPVPWY